MTKKDLLKFSSDILKNILGTSRGSTYTVEELVKTNLETLEEELNRFGRCPERVSTLTDLLYRLGLAVEYFLSDGEASVKEGLWLLENVNKGITALENLKLSVGIATQEELTSQQESLTSLLSKD